jgi:hypothetical protein
MTIQVVCPNGHVLKVADESAGKRGLCPVCKAPVKVPKPSEDEQLSHDAVLGILGTYRQSKSGKKPAEASGVSEPSPEKVDPDPARQMPSQDASRPRTTCPHCRQRVATGIHICPHCHAYIGAAEDS